MMKYKDFLVPDLGKGNVTSPLKQSRTTDSPVYKFVDENDRVLYDVSVDNIKTILAKGETPISFEKAGPRDTLLFEPAKTKAGIVTCGGLCPGLNNVIRSLVNQLTYRYGVTRILGINMGLRV